MVNCLEVFQIFCEWKTDKLCKSEQKNIWLYLKTRKVLRKLSLHNKSYKCLSFLKHVFVSWFDELFQERCYMFEP